MSSVNKNTKSNWQNLSIVAGAAAMLCTPMAHAQDSTAERMTGLEERIADLEETVPLRFGVGVETLYIFADSSESSRDKVGNYFLDKFELIVNGDFENGLYYRSRWDYQVTQQAFFPAWTYVGLEHSDSWSTEIGVIIQPLGAGVDGSYYDNSFLSDVPLWLGLANNSEPGIKTEFNQGNWDYVFAFTKNAELSSKPTARFRPDLIAQAGLSEVEVTNTFHGGGAYTIDLDGATLQLGSNGQYGDLYNTVTQGNGGQHWAATAFANYRNGGFALTLQGMAYDYNLERAPVGGPSTTDTVYLSQGKPIPANGNVYSTRISYTMPTSIGIFETVKFYHDYDYLQSGSEDTISADDTQFSIAGVHLSKGAFNTWVSVYTSKNAAFANGGPDDDTWNTQFTVTGALYF
ncbi:MAG TPA: hypothetical protein VFN01_10265 [Marinobacter sp.]|uniref:hypothetical protein n=1 Tax=Marinobacter sp. TaxID=50741 RepID=UPI002D802184|nr:hypothetical protein [Marinobacter sp.]HET8801557.1 hypothetical protein [Marinobacter sp.]